jgi:Zn-dependent protease/CBS domain-containing protein
MKPSIHIGKIAGVDVGVHYSWFLILALVSWSLAQRLLPDVFPGWSTATYWATGLLSGLLLFASVLVHELAHSLVAKIRGFRVEGITLFLLGGVSNLKSESRKARDEFIISAVGPLTSLLLAFAFGLIVLGFRDDATRDVSTVWFLTRFNVSNTPVSAVVWYLAWINLLMAGFNLLPAFPLDGGRVLRSVLWGATGSFSKATLIATRGGQVMGLGMIGLGALMIGLGALGILQGSLLGGFWFGLIGWFLHGAASSSRHEMATQEFVHGVRVMEVMDQHPVTIGPDVSIAEAVHEYFVRGSARSLPVCEGDRLMGIITLTEVKGVPQGRWAAVAVRDEMTPMPLRQVKPDDDLSHALTLLGEHSIHQVPVLEGDRLVGLLTRAHIIWYLHSRGELGLR